MRFQVPQFIEIEDKIFGPLTLKQFIYLAGGAGIAVICLILLPRFLALVVSAPFVGLSATLAFYKPNKRPFIDQLEAMFRYYSGNRLYVWHKSEKQGEATSTESETPQLIVPNLSRGKLSDMNWELDVRNREGADDTINNSDL